MKKLVFVLTLFVVTARAQELKQIPQISITAKKMEFRVQIIKLRK